MMALRPGISYAQARGNVLVTAPLIEPVSASELLTLIKADIGTVSVPEADALITQARQFIEEQTGIALIQQTWQLALDRWPGYLEPWWDGVREMAVTELQGGPALRVEFPRYPLMSVTSVKVYNEASAETTVTIASVFDIDTVRRPGRLGLKFGQVWPAATRPMNAVLINYVAGFGDSPTDVPAGLRAAVLTLAGYLYDHRGECEMPDAYKNSGARQMMSVYSVRGL